MGSSELAWVDGEVEDGSAELMGLSERRGGGSGVDYGERRRQWLSVRARGEPEEGEEHGESEGGREGDVGVGVAPLDASRASAEAGGGRRVAAGAGHALLVLLAGGGRRLARPVGWAEPGGLGQHR